MRRPRSGSTRRELGAVEAAELLVALEEDLALARSVSASRPGSASQRSCTAGPDHHVVEVEDAEDAVAQEEVAEVEVAVEAQDRRRPAMRAVGERRRSLAAASR